jgi:alkylation response protein AidB-like acyl-CoA dehydrogenase
VDLSFNQDQELIKNSVEKFITEAYDAETRRKIISSNKGYNEEIWQQFCELGWLALPFKEEDGGFGGDLIDLKIIMKSFGNGLVVEPYMSTVVLSGSVLSFCPNSNIRSQLIKDIIEGNIQVAFAFSEVNSRFNTSDVSTRAEYKDKEWVLNGYKSVVFGAGQADYILVSARTSSDRFDKNGISIFCVKTDTKGLEIQDFQTVDGFRAGEVVLNNVKISEENLISVKDEADKVISNAILKSLIAVNAEASGIMEKMYEMTLEYIKTRKQFGVAIGKFQVIQHRAVEMLILSDEMESLSSMSALKGYGSNEGIKSTISAKINIGLGGRKLGQEAIQLHGGMGVTEEMEIGQYFKRLTMLDTFLGNSDYYLDIYSKLE